MKININNCNNIEAGEIEIFENKLNLKYAINGTGKTSIAKAIEYSINGIDLNILKPFKFKNNVEIKPSVLGLESLKSIKIFNEEYVNKFVFLENELIKNSFEIFIKTEKYDAGIKEINNLLFDLKDVFNHDEELNNLINNLRTLSGCFGKSKTGYAASSSIGKGLANGNGIENIPEELNDYSKYIKSEQNVKWLKWQMEGKAYLEIDSKCPYCTSKDIETNKTKIDKLNEKYDSKVIEHLNKVLEVFSQLDMYFSDDVKEQIHKMASNIDGLKEEHNTLLNRTKDEIDTLLVRLDNIRSMGFVSLKDTDKLEEKIKHYIIDINAFIALKSKEMINKIGNINDKLNAIIAKIGYLKGEVIKQNRYVQELIQKYDNEINDFLKCAGINYNVSLELDEDEKYRMKFRHNDCDDKIDKPTVFLSYGEKNAFALILFMYEVLKDKPDIIILDDPISSFDKNKKYAIINMLFKGGESLRDKTVLLLTHDFEPIIDIKYVLPQFFNATASFLENKKGILKEMAIEKNDIKTFIQIVKENIDSMENDVIKLIYLRRLYELDNNKEDVYDLISSLLHKKEIPTDINNVEMLQERIESAEKEIKQYIDSFNYKVIYEQIIDKQYMKNIYLNTTNNYEKMQIFRVMYDDEYDTNDVIRKFINETFHIENEYLFQLNPQKYEFIPDYVVQECDRIIMNEEK